MDETELIRRVLEGDPEAERELYDAHVDRVFRLAYRMAGDEEMAKDFTQDTFVRVFSRLDGFRGDAALSTWIHSIAVSVILNGLRRAKRIGKRETTVEVMPDPGRPPPPVEPKLRERLRAAIERLPDRYRAVFLMHDVEGYTHEEIGGALRIASGTSKATLSRARGRLREMLADLAKEYAL